MEIKTEWVGFRCEETERSDWEILAEADNLKLAAWIRKVLNAEVKKKRKKK